LFVGWFLRGCLDLGHCRKSLTGSAIFFLTQQRVQRQARGPGPGGPRAAQGAKGGSYCDLPNWRCFQIDTQVTNITWIGFVDTRFSVRSKWFGGVFVARPTEDVAEQTLDSPNPKNVVVLYTVSLKGLS